MSSPLSAREDLKKKTPPQLSDVLRRKEPRRPMLTNWKKLPSDVKSISPGIIQSHTYSHTRTSVHARTHTHAHSSAASESNFLCTPSVTASFTPNFHPSLSISPENQAGLQAAASSLPGCLYDLLSAGGWGVGGMGAQQWAGSSQSRCWDCQAFLRGNHTGFSQITEALGGPLPASSGNEKGGGGC